jgi:hypothetical protein
MDLSMEVSFNKQLFQLKLTRPVCAPFLSLIQSIKIFSKLKINLFDFILNFLQ